MKIFRDSSASRRVAAVALTALALGACGSDDSSGSDDADTVTSVAESDTTDAIDEAPDDVQEVGPITVEGAPLPPYDAAEAATAIGLASPVVTGQSFDGTELVFGAPTESPTLLVFVAHWCPHCNDEIPVLIDLETSGRMPDGLDVMAVSTAVDPNGANYPPSEWIDGTGWPWPVMTDSETLDAINAVGGNSFPFAVVLDSDGTVLARRAGQASADDTVAFLESALADAAS